VTALLSCTHVPDMVDKRRIPRPVVAGITKTDGAADENR
jgi:hypothetical protein